MEANTSSKTENADNFASCGCLMPPISESIQSCAGNVDEKVTVKFKLDECHIIAQVYNGVVTLAEVIADLAAKFKVDAKYLELSHVYMAESPLNGAWQLWKLPHNEFSIIELELGLNKSVEDVNKLARRPSETVRLEPEVFYK